MLEPSSIDFFYSHFTAHLFHILLWHKQGVEDMFYEDDTQLLVAFKPKQDQTSKIDIKQSMELNKDWNIAS